MKRKIFDTSKAEFTGLKQYIPRALNYVVNNRNNVLSVEELTSLINPIRTILKSPMAEIFDRMVAAKVLNNFTTLYVPGKDSDIPELLASSVCTVDFKEIDHNKVLRGLSELEDKVVVNITNCLRRDKVGTLYIDAIDNLQNQYVRGQLVAAYNDIDDWIDIYSAEFCMKSYSMILSNIISRYFNLSLMETFKVRTVLALFMAQMIYNDDDFKHPPLVMRATWGDLSTREVMEIVNEVTEDQTKQFTIESVCKVLATHISDKMDKFNPRVFYNLFANLGTDVIQTGFALEYPPYWIYMLLQALSGTKYMMMYQLTQQRLINDGRSKFIQSLMGSSFINYTR